MSPWSWTGSGGYSDGGNTGIGDTGTHPEVDATVRLLHRRRGWGWTGGGNLLALVVFSVIGSHLWANASGALGVISGLVVLVLLALTVVGLVMAVVDTVRLHRRDGAVRDQARMRTSHHSLIAHAYQYPPRHHFGAGFGRLLLPGCLLLAIGYLPDQVNGVAYLAGAGPRRPRSSPRRTARTAAAAAATRSPTAPWSRTAAASPPAGRARPRSACR